MCGSTLTAGAPRCQDHPALERPSRQLATRRGQALEDRRLRLLEPGGLDVVVEGRDRPVVGTNIVALPALLVEPEPPPAPLPEVVLPPQPKTVLTRAKL